MCLGIPGRVLEVFDTDPVMGRIDFGGITKEICLAYVPEVQVGDFVYVHLGIALSSIDEQEAAFVFEALRELAELEEAKVE